MGYVMPVIEPEGDIWSLRAHRLTVRALGSIPDEEALIDLDAAVLCLRISYGEADAAKMDRFPFIDEDEEDEEDKEDRCTCPPDLRARGGFSSSCPVCGRWPE